MRIFVVHNAQGRISAVGRGSDRMGVVPHADELLQVLEVDNVVEEERGRYFHELLARYRVNTKGEPKLERTTVDPPSSEAASRARN